MVLSAAALAASAVPAVVQLGVGIYQGVKARQMEKDLQRPEYETPQEVLDAQALAERNAKRVNMPGQDLVEEAIRNNVADSLGDLRSMADNPSALLGQTAELILKSNEQIRSLGIDAAQMKRQAERDLMSQSIRTAMYKDKEFDYNKWQPYMADAAAVSAMKNSSGRNIYGGISSLSGGAANLFQADAEMRAPKTSPIPTFSNTAGSTSMWDPNAGVANYSVNKDVFGNNIDRSLLAGGAYPGTETGINPMNTYYSPF